MEIIAAIFVVAGLLWGGILWQIRPAWPEGLTFWLSFGSLAAGVVAGYDFFHRDFGPIPLTLDRVLLGMAAGILAYELLLSRPRPLRMQFIDWLVVAWLIWVAGSTLLTDFGYKGRLPLSRLLFFQAMPGVAYFVFRWNEISDRQRRLSLWVLVGLGVYLGFTGVAEWQKWHGWVFPRYIISPEFSEFLGRGRGPLLNPVINGIVMSLSGAACLLLWAFHKSWGRMVLIAAFLVITAGVVSTLTRSVWIAYLTGLFWIGLAPLTWRSRVIVAAVTVGCGLLVVAFLAPQLNRFKRDEFVSEAEMAQSASLRPLLALVAWEMFQDHPLTGVGYGQYGKHKKPYHQLDKYDRPLQAALPYMQHNVVLSYLTELGLFGLILAAGIWTSLARMSLKLWAANRSSLEARSWGLLLAVMLVNYLINGMFHDVSIIPMGNMLLLSLAGLAGSTTRMPRAEIGERLLVSRSSHTPAPPPFPASPAGVN